MSNRPGAELAKRPLHFIWILDCSGSMNEDGKIQALNNAISESIPHMRQVADSNPNANVLVRAVKFSGGAQWHVSTPIPVEDFEWSPLVADGMTAMGAALNLVADQLNVPPMDQRALPPVLVLITDGYPTDDFSGGLTKLMGLPWGKRAVRLAIAMGRDANTEILSRFIGNPEIAPLQANNAETLVRYITWASTVAVQAASAPASQITGDTSPPTSNVPLPTPPQTDDEDNAGLSISDVW